MSPTSNKRKRFNPNPYPELRDGVIWFFDAACCALRAELSDEQAAEEIRFPESLEPKRSSDSEVRS
jgi:hypothetical protein